LTAITSITLRFSASRL